MKMLFESWRNFLTEIEEASSSAVLFIFNDKWETLLLKRPDEEEGELAGLWGAPGGGAKPEDTTPEDTAKREGFEESGLKATVAHKFHVETKPGEIVHFFWCRDDEWQGAPDLSDEHVEWTWANYDALEDYELIPNQKELMDKAMTDAKAI